MDRKAFNKCSESSSWLQATETSGECQERSRQRAAEAEDTKKGAELRLQMILEKQHLEISKLVESHHESICQRLDRREHFFQRLEGLLGQPAPVPAPLSALAHVAEPSLEPPTCAPVLLNPGIVNGDAEPMEGLNETNGEDELEKNSKSSSEASVRRLDSTNILQKEDEAAYQLALKKARRLQTQETKMTLLASMGSNPMPWRARLHDFMQTALVESICAVIIFTNSVLIGVQTDYMAKRVGEAPPLVFTVVDAAYTVIFGLELVVRVLGSGPGFFYRDPGLFWNYLDAFIVLPSILELVLSVVTELPSVSTDITVVRILRITRVFRVIRVVKVMKFIRSLRQLVESVMHTMRSLAWSMLLLVVIIYVFAIMFTDASAAFKEEHQAHQLNTELTTYFGDLHISMHTLFRSVSGGIDWGAVAHTLGEVDWIWVYLFSLFVAFCCFAVLNVMTGIFCQVAVESSWNDPQLLLQHSIVERERQRELIRQLYHSFAANRSRRKITLIDCEDQFHDEGVQGLMNLLDIYPDSAWSLFKQLDDNGDGSITEEEFVEGVFRLKGTAKSWDMDKIAQEQRGLKKVIDMYFSQLNGGVGQKPKVEADHRLLE